MPLPTGLYEVTIRYSGMRGVAGATAAGVAEASRRKKRRSMLVGYYHLRKRRRMAYNQAHRDKICEDPWTIFNSSRCLSAGAAAI